MAVVRTKLTPGNHTVRGKKVNLTPQRFKAWADKFRALSAQGEQFGVPWGHFDEAAPGQKEFLSSKFNAGYVKDISVGPDGKLDLVLDCPALEQGPNGTLIGKAELPDGSKVETSIKEVSPGIWPEWTDGKGTRHTDLIGHVALTMMPVVANQPGFEAFSTERPSGVTYFATEVAKDDDAEELESSVDDAGKDDDKGEEDLDSILTPVDTAGPDDDIKELVALLAQYGVPLPADTNAENFNGYLKVALGVMIAGMNAKKAGAAVDESAQQQPPITEESGPGVGMMLSTQTVKDNPVIQSLLRTEVTRRRKSRDERIDALKKRGLPVFEAEKLRGAKIYLSTILSPTGQIVDDETDRTLTLLEKVMPDGDFAKTYLSTIAGGIGETNNPMAEGDATINVGGLMVTKAQAEEICKMGGNVTGSKT